MLRGKDFAAGTPCTKSSGSQWPRRQLRGLFVLEPPNVLVLGPGGVGPGAVVDLSLPEGGSSG